ncbi:MAG: hypothetical protein A2X84_11255 [Desulfuromonadaceae bacterium GWC2_58_13]|nr:MAG: hypothetical protein A2X84_11255 [Desulfuromonadaceae bacterium GWC2_58_13]
MAERERSSEDIRRDIAREEENLSQTVEQIGERIKEKLDWRAQVKDSPYWALGAAAGLGYFASKVFARRATPMERILGSLVEEVRGSLGPQPSAAAGTGLIRMTLLGIATRAAADWIRDECHLDSPTRGGDGPRPSTCRDSNIDPETNV